MNDHKEPLIDRTDAVDDEDHDSIQSGEDNQLDAWQTYLKADTNNTDCLDTNATSKTTTNSDNYNYKLINDLSQVEYMSTQCSYTSNLNTRLQSCHDSLRMRLPLDNLAKKDIEDVCDQTSGVFMKSQERKRPHDDIDSPTQPVYSSIDDLSETESNLTLQSHKKTKISPTATVLSAETTLGFSQYEGPPQCSELIYKKLKARLSEVISKFKWRSEYDIRAPIEAAISDGGEEEEDFNKQQSGTNGWQENIDGKQATMSSSYGTNIRYTSPQNSYERSAGKLSGSGRRYSASKLKRDIHRSNRADGYSKLGYPPKAKTSETSDLLQKLKRLLLLVAIIALCSFVLWKVYESTIDDYNYLGKAETSSLLGLYDSYAVSTDAKHCAKVGSALLAKGGSAVDAAIGTLLCMGVVLPNSLGLGGGCLMTIYDRSKKMATVIDGRETAPDYADEQMFVANPLSASRGPLSIGVPGELSAYWKAHQMFGKLNWSELFDGSIDLAENGHPMVEHLSYALKDWNHARYMTPALANMLTNNQTGKFLTEGELFVQKELANTLRRIRDNGAAEFYGGQTGQLFIDDLKLQGGKMTLENLQRYEAEVKQPLHFKLADDLHLYTQPPPGSGVVLSIIMRIMKELGYYKNLQPSASFEGSSLYYHHLVESFKFAYAKRAAIEDQPDDPKRMQDLMNEIMSDAFIKQSTARIDNVTHNSEYYGGVQYFQNDHGTAHVSVVDGQGNAAAVTTSVNLYFGSGLYSPRTGIIYNDVMDDFVSPNITNRFNLMPSQFNRIRPGRRPLSSMAPSIFTDSNGDVRLVIGASGGAKITTAIATVSIRNLYLGEDIKSSIDGHRIHHQYLPDVIWHERDFPKSLLYSLGERGHKITPIVGRSSVVMAIANDTHKITANSDYRKGGLVAGI